MVNRVFRRAGELLENNVDHHQDPLPEPETGRGGGGAAEHDVLGRDFNRNVARNIMRWLTKTTIILIVFKFLLGMVAGPFPLQNLLMKIYAAYMVIIFVLLTLFFLFIEV